MQKSKARRRLALKTSALGLAGTLALFVGSIVGLASPAEAEAAAADKTMEVTFTCATGAFASTTDVKVTITAPDSVAPSGTAQVKWKFPALTAAKAVSGILKIDGDLTVTGGTATSLKATQSPSVSVTAQGTYTPPEMTATLAAPATAGSTLTLTPVSGAASLVLTPQTATADKTDCTLKSANPTSLSIPVQTGGGTGTGTSDTAEYNCTLKSGSTTDTEYPVYPEIKLEFTPPSAARTNEEVSLTWKLTNQDDVEKLKVPAAGLPAGSKLFMTFAGSGAGLPATLTGEGAVSGTTTGADITLPMSLIVKAKATTAGSATLKPGNFTIGTSATTSTIECVLQNAAELKPGTYTVTAGSASPSPSPSPSPSASTSASVKPTRTVTATVTQTPVGGGNGKVTKTPKGAAETGGGGDMGPDGRMFVLTGSLVVLAAAAGGLVLRRRSVSRG
ncbi:hypothetical protein [Nonomuraea dietziae]|uniref:hypothetical protein n=1 Tax=Nonomuraea dietziae TaxID=65515 RepID=UPI00344A465C